MMSIQRETNRSPIIYYTHFANRAGVLRKRGKKDDETSGERPGENLKKQINEEKNMIPALLLQTKSSFPLKGQCSQLGKFRFLKQELIFLYQCC